MEPRELYEPEDIEQLLIERPYDELLEEERAFVLRHLSGRAEYEAMRALLLRVHDDDGPAEAMDADSSVRVHVIDLFRAQQQPQWRIWLNSVPAFLFPGDVSAMWRPALALASIGLVVMVAVIGLRRLNEAETPQLAQVQEKTAPVPVAEPQPSAADATTDAEQPSSTSGAVSVQSEVAERTDAPVAVLDLQDAAAEEQQLEAPAPPALAEGAAAMRSDELAVDDADMEATEDLYKSIVSVPVADSTITITGTTTHQVTANELSYNYTSAASAPQTVDVISTKSLQLFAVREKSKKIDAERRASELDGNVDTEAAADISAYVGLLRAAW